MYRSSLSVLMRAFLCSCLPAALAAADPGSYARRTVDAVKVAAPPTIDGDISDAAWKEAARAETFVDRQRSTTAVDQTTAWICYDDHNIYVAFDCKDSRPDSIIGRETIRDSRYDNDTWQSEDSVEVVFDMFRSYKWDDLTRFSVNAIGTPSARLGGGRAAKAEWKGDWEGASRRTRDGWTAEMRIPWRILNYPNSGKRATIGINFDRTQERTKTDTYWSDTGPQNWLDREGQWVGVQVPRTSFRPYLSMLPYILPALDTSRPGFRTGIDARYTLTPELTAVASGNPDFATIEGAVEGIAFSRSERYVPEKRPFFLEGRDYLGLGDDYELGPYFYSQRIESFDTGMKLYGKISPRDTLGFLNTTAFGRRNDLVVKLRHDLSPTSSAGAFLVQKSAVDDHNTVGVLNHNIRWGKFGVSSQLALSGGPDAGGTAKFVNWTYEDKQNFTSFEYQDVSPYFKDSDGLIYFTNHRGFHLFHDWGTQWRHGFFRGFDLGGGPEYDWHTDGRPFRRGGGVWASVETRSDWRIGFHANHEKFDDQTDSTWGMNLESGVSNRFRQWGISFDTGKRADEPYSFWGPGCSFRVLRKLDLGYGGSFESFEGGRQQHILTVNYEVSPTRSFGGRLVVQDADTNWYLSYRSAGALGTDVFFILGDPNAQRFTRRLAIKFVFAL